MIYNIGDEYVLNDSGSSAHGHIYKITSFENNHIIGRNLNLKLPGCLMGMVSGGLASQYWTLAIKPIIPNKSSIIPNKSRLELINFD